MSTNVNSTKLRCFKRNINIIKICLNGILEENVSSFPLITTIIMKKNLDVQ